MSTRISCIFLVVTTAVVSLATRGHLRPELCLRCGLMNPEQIRAAEDEDSVHFKREMMGCSRCCVHWSVGGKEMSVFCSGVET